MSDIISSISIESFQNLKEGMNIVYQPNIIIYRRGDNYRAIFNRSKHQQGVVFSQEGFISKEFEDLKDLRGEVMKCLNNECQSGVTTIESTNLSKTDYQDELEIVVREDHVDFVKKNKSKTWVGSITKCDQSLGSMTEPKTQGIEKCQRVSNDRKNLPLTGLLSSDVHLRELLASTITASMIVAGLWVRYLLQCGETNI